MKLDWKLVLNCAIGSLLAYVIAETILRSFLDSIVNSINTKI